jgi:hypothetical protein
LIGISSAGLRIQSPVCSSKRPYTNRQPCHRSLPVGPRSRWKEVALVAVMRKIITTLNAMTRDNVACDVRSA